MKPHDIAMLLKYQLEQNNIDERLFIKKELNNTTKRIFDSL